jgi:hypothetical protein
MQALPRPEVSSYHVHLNILARLSLLFLIFSVAQSVRAQSCENIPNPGSESITAELSQRNVFARSQRCHSAAFHRAANRFSRIGIWLMYWHGVGLQQRLHLCGYGLRLSTKHQSHKRMGGHLDEYGSKRRVQRGQGLGHYDGLTSARHKIVGFNWRLIPPLSPTKATPTTTSATGLLHIKDRVTHIKRSIALCQRMVIRLGMTLMGT